MYISIYYLSIFQTTFYELSYYVNIHYEFSLLKIDNIYFLQSKVLPLFVDWLNIDYIPPILFFWLGWIFDRTCTCVIVLLDCVKDYLVKNLDLLDPSILKDKTLRGWANLFDWFNYMIFWFDPLIAPTPPLNASLPSLYIGAHMHMISVMVYDMHAKHVMHDHHSAHMHYMWCMIAIPLT